MVNIVQVIEYDMQRWQCSPQIVSAKSKPDEELRKEARMGGRGKEGRTGKEEKQNH